MGRVGLANPVVLVALVALVAILGSRKLPRRILIVGIADTSCTRPAIGITVAIAVTTWLTNTMGVVRPVSVSASAICGGCIF